MIKRRHTFLRLATLALWPAVFLSSLAQAQSKPSAPDFSRVGDPIAAAAAPDPQLAPPPATPLVLKPHRADERAGKVTE